MLNAFYEAQALWSAAPFRANWTELTSHVILKALQGQEIKRLKLIIEPELQNFGKPTYTILKIIQIG